MKISKNERKVVESHQIIQTFIYFNYRLITIKSKSIIWADFEPNWFDRPMPLIVVQVFEILEEVFVFCGLLYFDFALFLNE